MVDSESTEQTGDVSSLLRQCQWPELSSPYDHALLIAVRFILERYTVDGILLGGTILEGMPDAASDLDIYVVHRLPQRQRLQRWFNKVPAEIFVNPPCAIRNYFVEERNRPCTANMMANGYVIYAENPVVEQLRNEAQQWLQCMPDLSEDQLRWLRYAAADLFDNAKDLQTRDPANARLILHQAVRKMLDYCFLAANRHLPREKKLLDVLAMLDTETAQLARNYYMATDTNVLFVLAGRIAERTIQVTGFFEWDSDLEDISGCEDAVDETSSAADLRAVDHRNTQP